MDATLPALQNKVFNTVCAGCHSGPNPTAGLRLGRVPEAELRDTLHRQSSAGMPYVTPSDPNNSFLFRKVTNTHGALQCPTRRGCGLRMPPSGPLPDDRIEALRKWIADGAQ